jgi:glycosidase
VSTSACAGGDAPDAGQDARGRDAAIVEPLDAPGLDAPTAPVDAWMDDAGAVAWPVRSCDVTVRWTRGGSSVQIAGDFNGWTPRAMPDVGGGVHEITLGSGDGLRPGGLHPYKLVVDGNWIVDPEARYRRYEMACINSAFRAPDCAAGPELVGSPVETTFDPATSTGSVHTRVTVRIATDGALPRTVSFTLDGVPVSATLDATGSYDVSLSGLATGRHLLAVRATDAMGRDAEPVDMPFWIEEEPFEWRDALMYMVVVDRFANGDRAQDRPVGAPVDYPADFHGGDLEGLLEVMRAGYFEQLGVNVLWLSPINQQAEGHFPGRDDGHEYAGYHGYWPSRARDVEPRFGGNEALLALVEEAHRRGIRVLFDLINNQIHEQHEYFAPHRDWFRTGCVCGQDPGCGWSERPLDCLFASYLPDINWRVPEAEDQFIADAIHWVDEFGIDGFRIDAVKHVETSSIFNLRAELNRRFEQGGERLYLVGETAVGQWDAADYGCGESFANGYAWIDAYVGEDGLDGQFDFPSHHRTQYGLVTDTMSFTDLEGVVRDMETRYRPEGLHVRFLGTHDSNRIASRAAMDPAVDCRWPTGGSCGALAGQPTDPAVFGRIRRAFTALYTMPGIPFLYYGDELAMPGGNDPDNRRDMIWTGPLTSVAMGGTSVNAEQTALREYLGAIGRARAESTALRRGRRVPLLVEPDLYVVAWTNEVDGALAVVAINRGGAVSGRAVDGLVATVRGRAATLELVAGTGSATLSGTRAVLTLPAGGSAVFLGRE